MNVCKYCNKEFKNSKSRQSKRKPSQRTVCGSCSVSKRRWKSKIEMIQKLGGKCNKCGYEGHPGAFHFHHIDPKNKSYELSANKLLVRDRWNELTKCELLCANCHLIEHSNTELIKKMGLF